MKAVESSGRWRTLLLRLVVTGVVLGVWFWTQSLLGSRTPPAAGGIGDALHSLTAGLNSYLAQNSTAANGVLIASSFLIDAMGVFLLGSWLFGGSVRPFLGLVLLMLLRQFLQALCSLPVPTGMIWHYPGFPSLLVTYHVANDFFFSGHTAIAVFGALELSRLHQKWLTVSAILLVLFEVAAVLALRAHYTMDIFTGILAALWITRISERISPALDRYVAGGR
jgi:PAP2 superfamily C-terminal